MDLVVWSQICCRWSGNVPCLFKYSCACSHVFLLWIVCHGTSLPEVFMVEKAFDIFTACPVYPCHHPHRPDLLHGGLQLPVPNFPVRHYELRMHLPATVSPLLVPCLHPGSKIAQNYKKWKLQNEAPLKDKHSLDLHLRLISCLPWQSRDTHLCSAFCIFFKTKSLYFYKLFGFLIFESPKLPDKVFSVEETRAARRFPIAYHTNQKFLIHFATARGGYEIT